MLPDNNDYKDLIASIKSKVWKAQNRVLVEVNREMIYPYWNIGKELNGQVK